jgi:uncharacterized cupin superfamily protein
VVREASFEPTDTGLVPSGEGWFVLNATDAGWVHAEGRGAAVLFEGEPDFQQVGINLYVLEPGESIGMYHWEANQEDFLVLSGDALLIIEGEERSLRQWDFVHCPVETKHIILGAGEGPSAVLAIGARQHQEGGWGGYTVDEVATRHGVGVEEETNAAAQAYAGQRRRRPTSYRDGWLPTD